MSKDSFPLGREIGGKVGEAADGNAHQLTTCPYACNTQPRVHGEGDNLAAGREHAHAVEELIGWSTEHRYQSISLDSSWVSETRETEIIREAANIGAD